MNTRGAPCGIGRKPGLRVGGDDPRMTRPHRPSAKAHAGGKEDRDLSGDLFERHVQELCGACTEPRKPVIGFPAQVLGGWSKGPLPPGTCRPVRAGLSMITERWPRPSPMRRPQQPDAFTLPIRAIGRVSCAQGMRLATGPTWRDLWSEATAVREISFHHHR